MKKKKNFSLKFYYYSQSCIKIDNKMQKFINIT